MKKLSQLDRKKMLDEFRKMRKSIKGKLTEEQINEIIHEVRATNK